MIEHISKGLIRFLEDRRPDFHHGKCRFLAGSDASGSISFEQDLFDQNSVPVEYILEGFSELTEDIRRYFLELNESLKQNVLEFTFDSPNSFKISNYWEQSIQAEFEQYLPKSKIGKIIAWYTPGSEYRKQYSAKILKDK